MLLLYIYHNRYLIVRKPNTRFNLILVLSRKLLGRSLLEQLTFDATFAPTLPSLYSSAKTQMQVKRMLDRQLRYATA